MMMTAQDIDAILATNVWPQLDAGAPGHRLLIGVAGMPGSGKSVMANAVAARINEARPGVATVVGMDGWHCSRAELDLFPDPAEAHARRGAAFTFRAADFASFVAKIRNSTTLESGAKPIFAPSFDHATKDPVPNGLVVLPRNRIVLVEGIYVGMDGGSWSTAARMFDQRWWIAAEDDVLVDRLVSRHVQTGVCPDAETARERALVNDLPNGREALSRSLPFHLVIRSDGANRAVDTGAEDVSLAKSVQGSANLIRLLA